MKTSLVFLFLLVSLLAYSCTKTQIDLNEYSQPVVYPEARVGRLNTYEGDIVHPTNDGRNTILYTCRVLESPNLADGAHKKKRYCVSVEQSKSESKSYSVPFSMYGRDMDGDSICEDFIVFKYVDDKDYHPIEKLKNGHWRENREYGSTLPPLSDFEIMEAEAILNAAFVIVRQPNNLMEHNPSFQRFSSSPSKK